MQQTPANEKEPNWTVWYASLIIVLVVLILFFYWFSKYFS